MPELRDLLQKHKGKIPHFDPAGSDVDIFAIPFRDKVREKARQTRIQQEIATGGKNAKQLKAEQRKLEKLDKKEKIREYNKERGRNPEKKRGKNARIQDDWDELAKEERLFKKLRKGKISQEEYDEQVDEL